MQTKEITALEILPDDWFFLAGQLYRVTDVNSYHNDTVGIGFNNTRPDAPNSPRVSYLTLHNSTPMQILNQ